MGYLELPSITPVLHYSMTMIDPFDTLCAEAAACTLCPGMLGRTAVLSRLNGALNPRILFVAEAPGRRGGDRTRIPMSGDASGRTFRHLMAAAGIRDEEVFITNAVLCNPRSRTGANRSPTLSEIRNCSAYLRRTIDLLDPPLVVSIGASALSALGRIEAHGLILGKNVGELRPWFGRTLIPLYHPSPQVLISRRSLIQQVEDWNRLSAHLTR